MAPKAACPVCPRSCEIPPGKVGICKARENVDGVVVDQNYGRVSSLALDPIEKKPLARFMPGSKVLSVGSYGCNLACPFCQNSSIACAGEEDVAWRFCPPEELVSMALQTRDQGNVGIAFTYNEPLVGFEYVRDVGLLAHENGLVNVLVSNGMANSWVIDQIAPLIDAANIDLKAFDQGFYEWIGGSLECVKGTIEKLARTPSCHLEVTTLVIPGKNDSPQEIGEAAAWLASVDPDITYHLTRFFPCHRMHDASPTPVEELYGLAEVARRHLRHVLLGNV